jgi:hypothetical protein
MKPPAHKATAAEALAESEVCKYPSENLIRHISEDRDLRHRDESAAVLVI